MQWSSSWHRYKRGRIPRNRAPRGFCPDTPNFFGSRFYHSYVRGHCRIIALLSNESSCEYYFFLRFIFFPSPLVVVFMHLDPAGARAPASKSGGEQLPRVHSQKLVVSLSPFGAFGHLVSCLPLTFQ